MAEIHRFSSRRQRLHHSFLANRLKGAQSYKRIAGYFRSSIFELVGEELADIPRVQIVCNSELDAADVVSKHVRETALKERWNEAPAEVEALLHKDRYRRLHALLTSGRVEMRVVPRDRVFVHGKAGVIEAADGSKTCFLGDTVAAILHSLWTGQSIAFILPLPTFFPQGAHYVRTGTIRARPHRGDYHRQRPPRTATRGLPSRP
jgi:hypothetical protein